METLTIEIVSIVKIAVGAAFGAAIAGLVAYLIGRKKNQADIHSTEINTFKQLRDLVGELVNDQIELRKDLEAEKNDKLETVTALKQTIAELECRLDAAETAIKTERREFDQMLTQKDREIEDLKMSLKTEKETSARQQDEINDLRAEIEKLKEIIKLRDTDHESMRP